jgi:hypothetical protein
VVFSGAGAASTAPLTSYWDLMTHAPSGIKGSVLREYQAIGADGRQLPGQEPIFYNFRPSYAIPTPLQLLHPIFGRFLDNIRDPTFQPSNQEYDLALQLATASSAYYSTQAERVQQAVGVLSALTELVVQPQAPLHEGCASTPMDIAIFGEVRMHVGMVRWCRVYVDCVQSVNQCYTAMVVGSHDGAHPVNAIAATDENHAVPCRSFQHWIGESRIQAPGGLTHWSRMLFS